MKKRIKIFYGRKSFVVDAVQCNLFGKFSGLMFSRREKAKNLLFEFKSPQIISIHSFFVFYPFIALWLDSENRILERKIVCPFTPCIFSRKKSTALLEIPLSKKNKKFLKFFDLSSQKTNI